MREIKFRAWEQSTNTMFTKLAYVTMSGGGLALEPKEIPLISPILMQFTGLKDKNDVEIYEGDIVVFNGIKWVCRWSDNHARFYFSTNLHKLLDFSCLEAAEDFEVIGNIYQNPELLK